ncbi:MAG: putative Response regulator [Candidatus Angelobacter sp.]|jgi:CheY-like chemotaxis protein|nr:putative Response regulator [Candidatus Angelobacter sp.]
MSTIPTVYFIDDSATMREVIKIAFRRENINVVACHDAATALAEIEAARPDIVITDVIMPDKDGYDVCQHIKSHPDLAKTPVILMSGVVNRAVAERAFAVKADELLRKPFQPQDLIARVKHLLKSNGAPAPTPAAAANAAVALSSIFSAAAAPMPPRSVPVAPAPMQQRAAATVAAPAMPLPITATAAVPMPQPVSAAVAATQPAAGNGHGAATAPTNGHPAATKAVPLNDAAKLKIEIMRLEGLVKKLQSELVAEREYSRALEAHVKTLQESD